jgi:hypothetical protein
MADSVPTFSSACTAYIKRLPAVDCNGHVRELTWWDVCILNFVVRGEAGGVWNCYKSPLFQQSYSSLLLSFPITFFLTIGFAMAPPSDTNYAWRPLTMTPRVRLLFRILSICLSLCWHWHPPTLLFFFLTDSTGWQRLGKSLQVFLGALPFHCRFCS